MIAVPMRKMGAWKNSGQRADDPICSDGEVVDGALSYSSVLPPDVVAMFGQEPLEVFLIVGVVVSHLVVSRWCLSPWFRTASGKEVVRFR